MATIMKQVYTDTHALYCAMVIISHAYCVSEVASSASCQAPLCKACFAHDSSLAELSTDMYMSTMYVDGDH